jgi:competence protein ComEA
MEWLKKQAFLFIVIGILLLTNIGTLTYFLIVDNNTKTGENTEIAINTLEEDEEIINDTIKTIKVDIKGYVKKPGVYEVEDGSIVNDLITTAGGTTKNGTTENLNLSKKLVDETVIVVLSKSELNKTKSSTTTCSESTDKTLDTTTTSSTTKIETDAIYLVPDSTEETSNSTTSKNTTSTTTDPASTKVSLNTATKEELMTLSGIGESKALSIIAYREKTKFTSIEEIKNVSGIGDALYEKIKDNITV